MLHHILVFLEHYGYLGLALGVFLESVGLPVPGETALIASAFAAAQGVLSLPLVIAFAAVTGILGDNLGYLLGRRLGRPWMERHGKWLLLTPRRLERMDAFFDRFGAAAVAFARFVAGVRVVAAFSAGVAHLRWRTFLTFNVIGAVAWATIVGLLGYGVGKGWQGLAGHDPDQVLLLFGGVGVVTMLAALLFHRIVTAPGRSWISRLAWHWVWIVGASVTAVLIGAKLVEDVADRESGAFDVAAHHYVARHAAHALDTLMHAAAPLGGGLVATLIALAAALFLWRRTGSAAVAAAVAAVPLLGTALVRGLKLTLHRPPPIAASTPGYSFPSGHATLATAVLLTAAYALVRERVRLRWLAAAVLVLTTILVGVSQVYLEQRWATDVLGGWAVGLFVATLASALYERLRPDLDAPLRRG